MSINFPEEESRVLASWIDIDAFHTQLALTQHLPPYTFYDGPPFATGTPHYGHLLASTIKDIIPRYWAMQGRYVERRFGWDTHGVPIEQIIDKQLMEELGVRGKAAVEKVGIEEYNARCRKVVLTYAGEWRKVVGRLGRWIDFDNDYKTMDPKFMESCWWAFAQLYKKDLVYHGAKVLPYSTALNTPLSKSEAQEDYRDVQDPAIVVSFPLLDQPEHPDTSLLAWTTTPWTLPSNVALCTHPEYEYIKIEDLAIGRKYILLEVGLKLLYKDPAKKDKDKFEILQKNIKGKDMLGWRYEPLFRYFYDQFKEVGFKVLNDTYVKNDEGVGIVHQSPAFGEDDYSIAWRTGIINEKRSPPNPLDAGGCFVEPVSDFLGQHVKAADKDIMKYLDKAGRMVKKGQITHRYPHCPRSKTPLIQRAVPSWFISVEKIVPDLLKNLEQTHWVPSMVKEARFHNWLAAARDWNVSRNRYWGTPIPLWISEDFSEIVCVGSVAELKELSGYDGDITDLHRDKIDKITIPSKQGKGELKRIEEVFDCWFESGSMPYASKNYPFNDRFPVGSDLTADFIAEGLDQTRGWFYTLSVLGTHLFGKFPYKNCVVNGIVLADDGKKMSKSLKNFPDPSLVMEKYGSDALRLYLIDSPVVRGEPLRFSENGVKQIVSNVMLKLWNSYSFFAQQVALLEKTSNVVFAYDSALTTPVHNDNVMDRWILASLSSLLGYIHTEMAAYRLYTVVPRLLALIDDTTNWYIRLNRARLKGQGGGEESKETLKSLNTLFEVLFTLVRALAPFTPFITDNIYQRLLPYIPESMHAELSLASGAAGQPTQNGNTKPDVRSVHFLNYPEIRKELFDPVVERQFSAMRAVIELGRLCRERRAIGLKTPLKSLVVVHTDPIFLADVKGLEQYVIDELNIRDLVLSDDEAKYGVEYSITPDLKTLGQKFKKEAKKVKDALPAFSANPENIKSFMKTSKATIAGLDLTSEDLIIKRGVKVSADSEKLETAIEGDIIAILDCKMYEELAREGTARLLIGAVQRLRKKVGLVPTDDVGMTYKTVDQAKQPEVEEVFQSQRETFEKALRKVPEPEVEGEQSEVIGEEDAAIGDVMVRLRLLRM
ncbi:isoleucine--tRNA ligase [Elasticomyces elasticus]|nr:isoleucine--tRNA ligase [Elasticomyces elasticus]